MFAFQNQTTFDSNFLFKIGLFPKYLGVYILSNIIIHIYKQIMNHENMNIIIYI